MACFEVGSSCTLTVATPSYKEIDNVEKLWTCLLFHNVPR
jgi:hypothetical protein